MYWGCCLNGYFLLWIVLAVIFLYSNIIVLDMKCSWMEKPANCQLCACHQFCPVFNLSHSVCKLGAYECYCEERRESVVWSVNILSFSTVFLISWANPWVSLTLSEGAQEKHIKSWTAVSILSSCHWKYSVSWPWATLDVCWAPPKNKQKIPS